MSVEFWCLFPAMALGLIHLSAASFSFKAQVGNDYTVGPRDEGRLPEGLAGRLDRAQRNFLETFALFAAAVLMSHALGKEGGLGVVGAVIYVGGRALFPPLYALGVKWLRTLSWNLATLGLVLVMADVVIGTRRENAVQPGGGRLC